MRNLPTEDIKSSFTAYLDSPLGVIEIKGSKQFITSVNFVLDQEEDSATLPEIITRCKKELEEYFSGSRQQFSVKVKAEGSTFQKAVWKELGKINYGDTRTYGYIARQMKDIKMSRAVGHANGQNPIAILVPCHRVVGEDGRLTGYMAGMWRKRWLLDLEGNVSGKNPTLFG